MSRYNVCDHNEKVYAQVLYAQNGLEALVAVGIPRPIIQWHDEQAIAQAKQKNEVVPPHGGDYTVIEGNMFSAQPEVTASLDDWSPERDEQWARGSRSMIETRIRSLKRSIKLLTIVVIDASNSTSNGTVIGTPAVLQDIFSGDKLFQRLGRGQPTSAATIRPASGVTCGKLLASTRSYYNITCPIFNRNPIDVARAFECLAKGQAIVCSFKEAGQEAIILFSTERY